jgi:LuxR family maltose regulon positive regulatory protein
MTFALTKIQPPRFRVGLIEREELEARLGAALLGQRLVLLMAPAGYGKTAALSRQLALLPAGCATAWVTADAEDDLTRFLACLSAALEPYDPPWRMAPEALAGTALQERGLGVAVDEFVNALGALPVEHGVIALDDMHSVTDVKIFEFIQQLLDRLPQQWSLAITTRVVPPLALARLGARRELAEFGQGELGFSRREVQRLCDAMGHDDAETVARGLHERTQGWAAGVCLSLSTAGGSSALTSQRLSQRHLFDYLASEVFGQMPEQLREFLMRCSVLPELTADRCAAISGNPRAADLLDEIERRGLFVSVLDSDELTLRLHDLFRDFLDDRLRREHADELPTLLRRAAEGERDTVRKVNLLLRAGAWEDAAQALVEVVALMLARGEDAQVTRLIEQFPEHAKKLSPQLAYLRGMCAWAVPRPRVMQVEMREAAAGFERERKPAMARRAVVYGALGGSFQGQHEQTRAALAALGDDPGDLEIELARAHAALWATAINGPVAAPAHHLNRLLDLLERSSPASWHQWFPFVGVDILACRRGMRAPIERLVRGASAVAALNNFGRLQALARNAEASLLLWQGRLDAFEIVLRQLEADEHWMGRRVDTSTAPWMITALHAAMRGDRKTLRATPAEINFFPPLYRLIRAVKGVCNAAIDEWAAVDEVLAVWDDEETMRGSLWQPFRSVLLARRALSQGRDQNAAALLREAVKVSLDIDRLGLDAMVRVHLALAEIRLGATVAAWQAVAPLVAQTQASDEIGGVLLCGSSSLTELAGAFQKSGAPADGLAELQRWLRLSRDAQVGQAARTPRAAGTPAPSILPLSARELEVLACIAAGESNKVIARSLDLSPHTVKRHVARILDRLDLSSRGEAAAWYHQHHVG